MEVDTSTLSKSVQAYQLALTMMNNARRELETRNQGFSAERCLLLCVVAGHPGLDFHELADVSLFSWQKVTADCLVLARGKDAMLSLEKVGQTSRKRNNVYLTKAGVERHQKILAKG